VNLQMMHTGQSCSNRLKHALRTEDDQRMGRDVEMMMMMMIMTMMMMMIRVRSQGQDCPITIGLG
jgi:hypothetical protein